MGLSKPPVVAEMSLKLKVLWGKDILIEVCSECHPFYTGKQKILDSGGRVDRFKRRFASRKL